jgi:hypothetical protein
LAAAATAAAGLIKPSSAACIALIIALYPSSPKIALPAKKVVAPA